MQTSTLGIDFPSAWQDKETMTYQGYDFYVLSKKDLISSKLSAGRTKDLEDVKMLEIDNE